MRLFVILFAATTPCFKSLERAIIFDMKEVHQTGKKVLCDKQPCLLLTCKNIGLMAGGIATLDLRFISLTKPHGSSSCLSHGFKTVWNLI